MFKRTLVTSAVLALAATHVQAQEKLERIEITGSSIKRVDAEGALPVITLKREDIEKSGATSVRDLIQQLPSMQGFTSASASVNGSGGGTTTASLRNLGEIYTLVLLNGRRVAPFNTGSTVNLEQLPLAAIERVEILADGASALYGADAIAGVVNFITRAGSEKGEVDLKIGAPERSGGKSANFSISKGFGDLERNGFNIFGALSYDKQERILASQREWSKSGVRAFRDSNGRDLYFWQLSINSDPPNVELVDADYNTLDLFNPVLQRDGNCGKNPAAFRQGDTCRFDYGSTVDLQPEAERKNLFLSGEVKLGGTFRAFTEFLYSDAVVRSAFAAPAQPLLLETTSPLYAKYVTPYLAARGVNAADVLEGYYYMRMSDAGRRADDWKTKGQHWVVGVDGQLGNFDVSATYTLSKTVSDDYNTGGYSSQIELDKAIANGSFDPFAQGTDANLKGIAPAVLNILADRTRSRLDVVSVRGSGPLFKIGDRDAMIGVGADVMRQGFKDDPHPIYQGPNVVQPTYPDFPIGSDNGSVPFDATRNSFGLFGELVAPVTKQLELTAAVRYDNYEAIQNDRNFLNPDTLLAPGKLGNKSDKTTYKLGFRYQPVKELMVRGSIGTGFRAPTLADVVNPLKPFGVIGTQRPCPVTSGDPLFVGCRTGSYQYRQFRGGNRLEGSLGLQSETSDQWTVGFRFEPSNSFTAGFDLWSVKIKNAIVLIPEDTAFDNFARYRSLFTVTTDPATQRPILTFNQASVNSAEQMSSGVDWDILLRNNLSFGKLTTQFQGTYLLKSYFDYGFGGGKESSLSKLGTDDQVASRVILRLAVTLDTGKLSNTLTWNWKPGYTDQSYTADDVTIRLRNADGSPGAFVDYAGHRVPAYGTIDWQGRFAFNKALTFTAGIKNLMDKEPPFSVKTVEGNMLGVDPRYHDVVGRQFYIQGNYKF